MLAIDVHTPGLGSLLRRARTGAVYRNIRAMEADAVSVVESMIAAGSLHGVRIYFPDPWPKPRHHKRRLMQPEFVHCCCPDSAWWIHPLRHRRLGLWPADARRVRRREPRWSMPFDGYAPRPADRPVTKYERRASRHGRSVVDVYVTRRLDAMSKEPDLKPRSRDVTDGMERAPNRAMLRAVGMTDDDWDKPQIGIASSWNEITPCNLSLEATCGEGEGRRLRGRGVPAGVHARSRSPTESPWATRGCGRHWSAAR